MNLLSAMIASVYLLFASPATEAVSVHTHTWNLPNVCDRIDYSYYRRVSVDGKRTWRTTHKKIKQPHTKADRKRARNLARLVAREMGADYRLLLIWMDRGSNSNPHAIHTMIEDLQADRRTYNSHTWSQSEEDRLRVYMDKAGPQRKGWWAAKHELSLITDYKYNPYYGMTYDYEHRKTDGETKIKDKSLPVLALKHGPLDWSPFGLLRNWDTNAPPWIACNNDGLIAYISAIWMMRDFQRRCAGQIENGKSSGVIDRMYARGHCREPSDDFIRRAGNYHMNPDKKIRLGSKWPQDTTNRKEVFDYMMMRAKEEGII